MSNINITANPLLSEPLKLQDLGVEIAPGESIQVDTQEELDIIQESEILLELCSDEAFGSTSTIILSNGPFARNGSNSVPQSIARAFLLTCQWPTEGPFSLSIRNSEGELTRNTTPVFCAADSAGGTLIAEGSGSSPFVDLVFDTVNNIKPEGAFELSADGTTITVFESADYDISFSTSWSLVSGRSNITVESRLVIDVGSGFELIPGTLAPNYTRNAADGDSSSASQTSKFLPSGSRIKIQARRVDSANAKIESRPNGSTVLIRSLQGQRGAKGNSGTGASIDLLDNGILLPGSPFSRLNFVDVRSISPSGDSTADIVIGSGFNAYAESLNSSQTTSGNFRKKLTLDFTAPDSADYEISWSAEVSSRSPTARVDSRVQLDNTITISETDWNPDPEGGTGYGPHSGFARVALSAGPHSVEFDYRSTNSGETVRIRNVRLKVVIV